VILPAFYQTLWFYGVLFLITPLIVWRLLRIRVRRLEERLRVRRGEREAIARELHDTLLQSTQGLIYSFQSVAEQVDRGNPLRAQMERSLDIADGLLKEARARVSSLRTSSNEIDLEAMIGRAAVELFTDTPTRFSIVRAGSQRPLRASCAEEVYLIAREALTNVRQHAHAAFVEVGLKFGRDRFGLNVRDDGCGMSPSVAARESVDDHLGITGMRERAGQLQAKFFIFSGEATGTELELVVPAKVAYLSTA
jgi:signal transduction histidine kinase